VLSVQGISGWAKQTKKVVCCVFSEKRGIVLPVRQQGEESMNSFSTTRMSSKGQVVIPEDVRKRLGLETGAQFLVVGEKDVVILKTIAMPSMNEFDGIISRARQQARSSGMKTADIATAIAKVRGRG
jgi:AbrB family looped-hinge helix DNA binding protein